MFIKGLFYVVCVYSSFKVFAIAARVSVSMYSTFSLSRPLHSIGAWYVTFTFDQWRHQQP